jgi:hypothetical protein
MKQFSLFCILCLVTAMLLLGNACGGNGSSVSAPLAQLPTGLSVDLPAVAALKQASAFAFTPRFRDAEDYLPGSAQLVTPGAETGTLKFEPDYPLGGGGSGPAWSVYALNLADYSGPQELYLEWTDAPAIDDLYIAVANFATGRWEWQSLSSVSYHEPPVDADHISATDFYYIVVLRTGTAASILNWLRIGGNIAPDVALFADPSGGFESVTADLAVYAYDPEGEIILFEFDEYGNGTFVGNGTIPLLNGVLYSSIGAYHPAVRVYDDDGGMTEASTLVGVGWIHSYGQTGYEEANRLASGPAGSMYLTGLANSWGEGANEPAYMSYGPLGSPLVQRTIGRSSGESATDIASNAAGTVLITGSSFNSVEFTSDFVIFQVSPGGVLNWQKTVITPADETGASCQLDADSNAFVAFENNNGVKTSIKLMKFDPSGTVDWQLQFGSDSDLSDPQLRMDSSGNMYLACMLYNDIESRTDLVLSKFDATPSLLWSRIYSGSGDVSLTDMELGSSGVLLCGNLTDAVSSDTDCLLLSVGAAGEFNWQQKLDMSGEEGWAGLSVDPASGDILLVGSMSNQDIADGSQCGTVARYSGNGILQFVSAFNQPMKHNGFNDILGDGAGGYYIVGRGPDNVGVWYTPLFDEIVDISAWENYMPTILDSGIVPTDYTAVMNENTVPVPVIDSGGGSSDMVVLRWFEP